MTLPEALAPLTIPPEPRCPDPHATVDCFACGGKGWVVEASGPDTRRATCERCGGAGTEVCHLCGDSREAVCVVALRESDTHIEERAPLCWSCFVACHKTGDVVRVVVGDVARTWAGNEAMEVK